MKLVKTIYLGKDLALNFFNGDDGVKLYLSVDGIFPLAVERMVEKGFTLYTVNHFGVMTENHCTVKPHADFGSRNALYYQVNGLDRETILTYCTLCNRAIASDIVVSKGKVWMPEKTLISCQLERSCVNPTEHSTFYTELFESVIKHHLREGCEDNAVRECAAKAFTPRDSLFNLVNGNSPLRKFMVGGLRPIEDEPTPGMVLHSELLKENRKPESAPLSSPYGQEEDLLADILAPLFHLLSTIGGENDRSPLITAIDDLVMDAIKNDNITETEIQQVMDAVNVLKRLES